MPVLDRAPFSRCFSLAFSLFVIRTRRVPFLFLTAKFSPSAFFERRPFTCCRPPVFRTLFPPFFSRVRRSVSPSFPYIFLFLLPFLRLSESHPFTWMGSSGQRSNTGVSSFSSRDRFSSSPPCTEWASPPFLSLRFFLFGVDSRPPGVFN